MSILITGERERVKNIIKILDAQDPLESAETLSPLHHARCGPSEDFFQK